MISFTLHQAFSFLLSSSIYVVITSIWGVFFESRISLSPGWPWTRYSSDWLWTPGPPASVFQALALQALLPRRPACLSFSLMLHTAAVKMHSLQTSLHVYLVLHTNRHMLFSIYLFLPKYFIFKYAEELEGYPAYSHLFHYFVLFCALILLWCSLFIDICFFPPS